MKTNINSVANARQKFPAIVTEKIRPLRILPFINLKFLSVFLPKKPECDPRECGKGLKKSGLYRTVTTLLARIRDLKL
jgi:hypothetical protein